MIPKIFHEIWVGDKPIPHEFIEYRETWQKLHPGWSMILWTDKTMPHNFINQEAYDEGGIVLKSDIARLELIYQYGGIYVDTDFECYKNIEPLIKNKDTFFTGERNEIIGNAIFGATQGHPVIWKLLAELSSNIKRNALYGPNYKAGPMFFTKFIDRDEINYIESSLFFPTLGASLGGRPDLFPDAYANHHFAGSWVGGEEEKVSGYMGEIK